VIVVDTGPLVALADADDDHHAACVRWYDSINPRNLVIPGARTRAGPSAGRLWAASEGGRGRPTTTTDDSGGAVPARGAGSDLRHW
jgi:hypothetical protein